MDFEEEDLAVSNSSISDSKFDLSIGHIEDIIMDDRFQELQSGFLEKYYLEFEDNEENKFIYTDIHNEYCGLIEKYLEEELCRLLPDFKMAEFTGELMKRKDDLDGEVFEMLLTFSDFVLFKEMFVDYRAAKEGRTADLSMGITVTHMELATTDGTTQTSTTTSNTINTTTPVLEPLSLSLSGTTNLTTAQ